MSDGFDFTPLSYEEREVAADALAPDDKPNDAVPSLPPADAEPGSRAAARLFGRAPDSYWRYATAEGETAFYICRWNAASGEKEIRPLSWIEGEGWRFKQGLDARRLYNLDLISANEKTHIVVCEGEKAADAAATVFFESIATTSSGGSNAVKKSDWTPLAGRKVLIWPDNDKAGVKYAREVGAILAALGCEVSTIDASALAAIDPVGGSREAMEKWDAANAIGEWRDLGALRKAALGSAKAIAREPEYVSFGIYEMGADGLFAEIEKGRGEARVKEAVWIAAPFEILGACRDPQGGGWGKWLRWRDGDSRIHRRHVSDAALQGEPAPMCAELASQGLRILRGQQRHLANYLSGARVSGRVTMVDRTGWHEISGQWVFVLPEETIGPRGAETVILDAAARGGYEARGTLKEWRKGIGTLASGHVLPVLAISAAFAGALLRTVGQEGGGLNFFGPSSRGKTTLLQAAASVWGRGGSPGFVKTWRATANGLEGAAAGATDTALVLDELGQVEARDAAAALYALATGAGKTRAGRDGGLRESRSWRVMFLSSGEIPIETKLAEDRGRPARAGQLVRMLDIPVERAFGVFDNAGAEGDASALAKAFKLGATTAFGTAGPEFVRRLIAEGDMTKAIRDMVSDWVAAKTPPCADGQIDRAAQRLGLIAAAGELATALGVTPWREGEASEAAAWALASWIEGRGGAQPAEVRQAIQQVRLFIEQHGESRFDSLDAGDARPVVNRAGWRKGAGADRQWLIPTEVWKSEVCKGLDSKFVARTLGDRGIVERAPDGFQAVRRIEGTAKRVYVITSRIFDGGADEA